MRFARLFVFSLGVLSTSVFAQNLPKSSLSNVEMSFELLNFQMSSAESGLDSGDVTAEKSAFGTTPMGFGLTFIFKESLLDLNYLSDTSLSQGGLDWALQMGPNFYVGAAINLRQANTETETDPDSGAKTKVKSKTNAYGLGPVAIYRERTEDKLLTGSARALYIAGKNDTELGAGATAGVETDTTAWGLVVEGHYLYQLANRFWLGVGGQFGLVFGGDLEIEDNAGNNTDGDYSGWGVRVSVLEFKYDLQ